MLILSISKFDHDESTEISWYRLDDVANVILGLEYLFVIL